MEQVEKLASLVTKFLLPPQPGDDSDHPLDLMAVPGLMTILDVALYRSVEGQLTATVCSGHCLLHAWLDLKRQSQLLLDELKVGGDESPKRAIAVESFARLCIESSWDACDRISTDKLAQSANLRDPYDTSSGGGSNHVLSGVGTQGIVNGVLDSKDETGRRFIFDQRAKDCWESSRLFCPDYVWADDVFSTCQRLLRNLTKRSFWNDEAKDSSSSLFGGSASSRAKLSPFCERYLALLLQLIKEDIPVRLYQFRAAVEANSVVSKRLYLVKCECRAPFRAFLEAHQSVVKAPPLSMVNEYLALKPTVAKQRQEEAKNRLQSLLENPALVEVLVLERECEEIEIEIARALFPFTEMGRILEHKRARLVSLPGQADDEKIIELQDLLQRLKYLLCRRAGPETSTGIRPLLLDIRGMPRDEDSVAAKKHQIPDDNDSDDALDQASQKRLDTLIDNMKLLGSAISNRNSFLTDKRDVEFPATVIRGCTEDFDGELLHCQIYDYFTLVKQQREKVEKNSKIRDLEGKIRKAEMNMSLAVASHQSLEMVRQRLQVLATDREKRFDVLKQMIEEVCLREMNLHVRLEAPSSEKVLVLKQTSALGLFGHTLQDAGEPLPIG